VRFTALDQQQSSGAQGNSLTVDNCQALAVHDEKPLIRAAVTVVGPSFGRARGEGHLRALRTVIAQDDSEALAKLQVLVLHGVLSSKAGRIR